MFPLRQIKQLPLNPMAFVLGLLPASGRLLMLFVAAIISGLMLFGLQASLETLEERLGALGWTLSADDTPEESITLVSIDERSLAEVGPWPWSRQQMASLVTAIDRAGARLQLHDIAYPESRPGDDVFLAALQSARGAVLAQVPVLQSNQAVRTGLLTHAMSGITCSAVSGGAQIAATQNFVAPHSDFAAIPKGHITPIIASDGAIRKIPAAICVDGAAYPALVLSALLQGINSQSWGASVQAGDSLFDSAQVLRLESYPGLDVPLDSDGNLRISYARDPSAYRAISAVDVLNGSVDNAILQDAWVLVGGTAFGMGDIWPTPYNGATPGIEVQARLLGSLLDVAMPYTPRGASWLLGLLSLIFAGSLYLVASTRGRLAAYGLPLAALLLPLFALALHIQLLSSLGIWLGWISPALFGTSAACLLLLLEQSRVREERSRVFGNLNSYLPADIAKEIAYTLPSSSINARRSNVTLLSADLRNFSAFGEARPPEESAAVLHFFFTRATEIIESHGGRVHEFKGDSLLAVWDGHDARAAALALAAAESMQEDLNKSLLPEYAPAGLEPMALGIGIEQGPVLIGSIGPAHRRSHALLGDTVGITLRIQEMTEALAQPILVGECAARQLGDLNLESQGSYLLAGLKIPHILFAPVPSESFKQGATGNTGGTARSGQEQPNLKLVTGGRP